jgi:hypothetical protein
MFVIRERLYVHPVLLHEIHAFKQGSIIFSYSWLSFAVRVEFMAQLWFDFAITQIVAILKFEQWARKYIQQRLE